MGEHHVQALLRRQWVQVADAGIDAVVTDRVYVGTVQLLFIVTEAEGQGAASKLAVGQSVDAPVAGCGRRHKCLFAPGIEIPLLVVSTDSIEPTVKWCETQFRPGFVTVDVEYGADLGGMLVDFQLPVTVVGAVQVELQPFRPAIQIPQQNLSRVTSLGHVDPGEQVAVGIFGVLFVGDGSFHVFMPVIVIVFGLFVGMATGGDAVVVVEVSGAQSQYESVPDMGESQGPAIAIAVGMSNIGIL